MATVFHSLCRHLTFTFTGFVVRIRDFTGIISEDAWSQLAQGQIIRRARTPLHATSRRGWGSPWMSALLVARHQIARPTDTAVALPPTLQYDTSACGLLFTLIALSLLLADARTLRTAFFPPPTYRRMHPTAHIMAVTLRAIEHASSCGTNTLDGLQTDSDSIMRSRAALATSSYPIWDA